MNEAVSRELLERRIADELATVAEVPAGGTTGTPLVKASDADYDAAWSPLTNAGIAAGAAIQLTKLEAVTAGSVVLGNASNVATATAITGDVTISSTGVTSIANDAVVTADILNDAVTPAKIQQGTAGQLLITNATPDTAWVTVTGDVTISSAGVTSIAANAVVTADILNDAVTPAKIAQGTAGQVLITNATPDTAWVTLNGHVTVSGTGATVIQNGVISVGMFQTIAGGLAGTWNSATVTTRGNISGAQVATIYTWVIGKTYVFQLSMPTGNTATAAGAITFTLPSSVTAARSQVLTGRTSSNVGLCTITGGVITLQATAAGANFTAGQALGTVNIAGTIEIN